MAKTDQAGFVEQHIEKVILAAAVVFLAVVAVMVFISPKTVTLASAPTLGEVGEAHAAGDVDAELKSMADAFLKKVNKVEPTPVELDDPPKPGPYDLALDGYGPWGWPPKQVKIVVNPGVKLALSELIPLPTPSSPVVKVAREMIVVPKGVDAAGAPIRTYEDGKIAVHGAATFRHGEMLAKWAPELAKRGLPARLVALGVEVRRREMLPDGTWSEPVLIDRVCSDPTPLPPIPAYDDSNIAAMNSALLAWGDQAVVQVPMELASYPIRIRSVQHLRQVDGVNADGNAICLGQQPFCEPIFYLEAVDQSAFVGARDKGQQLEAGARAGMGDSSGGAPTAGWREVLTTSRDKATDALLNVGDAWKVLRLRGAWCKRMARSARRQNSWKFREAPAHLWPADGPALEPGALAAVTYHDLDLQRQHPEACAESVIERHRNVEYTTFAKPPVDPGNGNGDTKKAPLRERVFGKKDKGNG